MKILTIDFETYYDKTFSLTKLTTEEYIRDPSFETIGVAVKIDNGVTEWASGDTAQIKEWLQQFPWSESIALAHNAMFDGAILNWHYDIRPSWWIDTLCMGRAIHGVEVGGSLAALTERYGLGEKGTEVQQALGKHRADFSAEELSRYGDYCINDVDLTYKLCDVMIKNGFPKQELKLIDLTLRMFVEPKLELDLTLLESHLIDVRDRKEALLKACGLEDNKVLMSNPKFAEVLKSFDVDPPTKISLTTNKETWAFAKSDEEFKALAEHPDDRIQALVAARLGSKSTLEETRTERFIGIAKRGTMPVPLKYYAAHTGRWGGTDNLNMQNLPSRGANRGKLKSAILAPAGYVIIDCDSSQIEARVLVWLAEQEDMVEVFKNNNAEILSGVDKKDFQYDPYKLMAAAIYNKRTEDVTDGERFIGKTTILGAGYGMGALKFQEQLKKEGTKVDLDECRRIISTYRESNSSVVNLWKQGQIVLTALSQGSVTAFGRKDVLTLVPDENAIRLPSGLLLRYEALSAERGDKGLQYSYKTRRGRINIYGGKVVENVVQALARIIVGDHMVKIAKKYRPVLSVHDAVACIAPEQEAEEAKAYVEGCMRTVPDWASGLPVNCESGVGKSYGEC
jgi:DNA polymerase I-like protein with 3'-5' exonuclease and polymerase domains